MKSQYLPTENIDLVFPQFVNAATGALLAGDALVVTYLKPDKVTTGTVAATWQAAVNAWTAQIPAGSYVQGQWIITAVSNGTNALPETVIAEWGDWCANIGSPAQASVLGAAVGATISADIAAVKASVGTPAQASVLGTPAGVSLAADVAAAKASIGDPAQASVLATTVALATTAASQATTAATQATSAATQATLARKAGINRLKVDTATKTQILYEDDGTTPAKTWNLKDESGVATATRIFERGAPS